MIRELPEHVVNKIAAGEVVERPASVVKELVENSLDAGATRVRIELLEGGKKLIRVIDDGRGIPPVELPLAFKGHATSKLSTVEELEHITTLGFRGEALASIAAVSMARITSRIAESEQGASLTCVGGRLGEVTVAGCPPGTRIEVERLFFNTPARLKFLKASSTEISHVTEAVARLALGQVSAGIELRHGDRLTLSIAGSSGLSERIGAIAGREVREKLVPIPPGRRGEVGIEGFVLPPEMARSRASSQYLFLNGRFIRDRSVLHAVAQAYREVLIPGRYPVFFLFLSLDPSRFDVNVHPTKIEVRFANPREIHDSVYRAVRETLEGAQLLRRVSKDPTPFPHPAPGQSWSGGASFREGPRAPVLPSPVPPTKREPQESLGLVVGELATPRYLQVFDSFIVEEGETFLVLHDQHALHERILHEEILARMEDGRLPSQRLLVPELHDIGAAEVELLVAHREALETLGLEIEAFGGPTLAVHAVPALSSHLRMEPFLADLVSRFRETDGSRAPTRDEVLARAIDTAACRSAVKSGDRLSGAEIAHLLTVVRKIPLETRTCVHGRPTRVLVDRREIERWFERR